MECSSGVLSIARSPLPTNSNEEKGMYDGVYDMIVWCLIAILLCYNGRLEDESGSLSLIN